MRTVSKILPLVLALGLSACGVAETASRNALNLDLAPSSATPAPTVQLTGYSVDVPRSLKVSEANAYIPKGDIVWRGDPRGDRYTQVQALFEEGLRQSQAQLTGATPVVADIKVRRFHAITEKARYTTGGVHHMVFDISLRHAQTGQPVGETRTVTTDLIAYGGSRAIEAEAQGETQKVRITRHLARAIAEELTLPGGHRNARMGIIQAMNRGI